MTARRPSRGSDEAQRAQHLTRLSRAFSDARSLDDIVRLAVAQTAELLEGTKAVLMLADDRGLLHVRASHGIEAELLELIKIEGTEQAPTESLLNRLIGLLGAQHAAGFVGVPLVSGGRVIGLLAGVRGDGATPTEDDERLLSALADQLVGPLENARLALQLERTALLAENVRLFEAEREARLMAEEALRRAELARDAAVQADTTKTQFLTAMSHELRTPLNAIGGYADLLELGLRGPVTPEQVGDLQRIKASQLHLLHLINDVLEYARLGAGPGQFTLEDLELNAVLRDTEAMILPQAQMRGLRFSSTPCADETLTVRADSHRLKQILLNLLSNAIKFTEAGGTVRMWCDVEPAAKSQGAGPAARVVHVHVEDTGRGIPPDQVDAIWQPFVQLGRTLNRPTEGVGLGLAISRDLARRIGGELGVVSEPGRGSTFTLTLPLVAD